MGRYLDPPAHATVFCVDETPQIQALARTQPLLPQQPGHVERQTHDYKRQGTTTLFAALNAKSSEAITHFHQRHGRRSSANSSISSMRASRRISTCASSWTTTAPTKRG